MRPISCGGDMTTIAFEALDFCADQTFAKARYRYQGDEAHGWRVERDGAVALQLGPGYRLLRVRQCGVCSTDLARSHLPFPLPQVLGHEVVAEDEFGRRYVVEINASHAARGLSDDCPFCAAGLQTHCPDRVTLGIHDLPGGFGPWILCPIAACLEVPASVPDSAAVLVEPFAAALHAAQVTKPRSGERVAVLGPRRLGMLVIAALGGVRAQMRARGEDFSVEAVVRDPALQDLAMSFGADRTHVVGGEGSLADGTFDVVVDTTGNPEGLDLAVRLARREVHLKSTHGQAAGGLARLTELVVDELSIRRMPDADPGFDRAPWSFRCRCAERPRIAWLAKAEPPEWLLAKTEVLRGEAGELAARYADAPGGLPRADAAVVDSAAGVDQAIRPRPGIEAPLVRPRGPVLLHAAADVQGSTLLHAVRDRGLALTSSRCGDFQPALQMLAGDPELVQIGERLVTHRFGAKELATAFSTARSRACIKAIVSHGVPDRS